jgi:hypothetical protein
VYGGPGAANAVAAQDAAAFTFGNAVVMGTGASAESPETLGLLAHELTHVARSRRPQFIPPIVNDLPERRTETDGLPRGEGPMASEESLARQVEERVRGAAQRRLEPSALVIVGSPPEPAQAALAGGSPERLTALEPAAPELAGTDGWAPAKSAASAIPSVGRRAAAREESPPMGAPVGGESNWGGLPAPWEPLPDWLAPPGRDAVSHAPSDGGWAEPAGLDGPAFLSQVVAIPGSTTQRAETGRQLVPEAPAAAAPEGRQPEPDLDALARQVYSILRRRLAVEQRRTG